MTEAPEFARAGPHTPPRKFVVPVRRDVRDHDRQHPLVHVNPCHPIRHRPLLAAGAERVPTLRYSGSQARAAATGDTATPTHSLNTHTPDHPIQRSQSPHWHADLAAPNRHQSPKSGPDYHAVSRAVSFGEHLWCASSHPGPFELS